MLGVNLLLLLLSLLTNNVQAADSYFGNRNWNLRRPITLASKPNPVVNPIHSIPKPLPNPIEVGSYNAAPEIREPITVEVKPTENYKIEQPTTAPSYRLLPQREQLIRYSTSRTKPPAIIATESTTVEEPQATTLYTDPPKESTSDDDIQVFPTKPPSNPSLRRPMVPRPVPRPARIEMIKPQPALESEITTTAEPIAVDPVIENTAEINPVASIVINNPEPEATVATVLPETQPTPEDELELVPEPYDPEIGLLKTVPEEAVPAQPEAVLDSLLPEKVESIPEPQVVVVEKEFIRPLPGYSQVRTPRPLAPLVPVRRPEINTYPYRIPKPVVTSPRPIIPKIVVTPSPVKPKTVTPGPIIPKFVVTPSPVKPTTVRVTDSKPGYKSIVPSNPGSQWSTPAPTQLLDYKCSQSEGYYGITGDCDNYVECRKYTAIMYSCPDGLHYNPKARWPEYPCGYPSEVKCETNAVRQKAHPTDECPQQYGFYPIDSECSRYIMCQEGIAFVMNCPAGLVFNSASSSCDWPENVPSCKPDVFHGFTCPAPPLEEDGSPSEFIYKYRYKESCKEYIACQRGHPRLLRCDDGLSFDEESEVCVDSDYVSNCRY